MRRLTKLILLISIYLLSFNFLSFSQGDVSENGLFVASLFIKSGHNVIFIHKFMNRKLVREIKLVSSGHIDKIKFSPSGKFLYAQNKTSFYVVDVMQGKIISSIFGVKQIVFSSNDDFFLVLKANSIFKYSCASGKLLSSFAFPAGKKIYKLTLCPNNKIFSAQAIDRVYIYSTDKTEIQKTLAGVDIKFRADGYYFTVLTVIASKIRVSTYNSESLYLQRTLNSDLLLTYQKPAGKLLPTRCTLGKEGKYAALYTAKNFRVQIYIYNTWTNKLVWIINNFANTKNELFPQVWTNASTLIAYGQYLMAGEYDVINKQSIPLGLRIDGFDLNNDLSQSNQLRNRKISDNYHYVAIQSGLDLYIRDSRLQNKKMILKDVQFISYSHDSKYLFVKKNNTVNAIVLGQLTSALQANVQVKLYAFDRLMSTIVKEKFIPKDSKPPRGYAYFYVNNTKQIVKVDTAKLHYTLRSMKMNGNNVELQVNLVDANGNQFLGATDPSWRYIWCNLLLQNPNGIVRQINDFKVQEVNETQPTAYALVLDESGSMGIKRANELQFGASDLVAHKRPQDAYLLIKYDNHVKIMNSLTKQKYPIQRYLNNTGLVGFGGGTALVDAALLAVKKLSEVSSFSKKVIILFTDGFENASLYTKYDLLTAAKKYGIEINVIGFGNKVNEKYLKSIAYNTGGLYVHLYKTKDLRKVFRDIDFKRKNYYRIKFKTQIRGKHIAFLQLCQDQFKHDSLWVRFDNSVQRKPIDKQNPILPLEPKRIRLTSFDKLKIPINPPMKPVKSRRVNNEFSNIHFPNIQFATSSDKIVKSEQRGIDEIVKFMRKYPYVFLEIHGHTDNQGGKEFNMKLSKKRALAAKNLIVKAGIAPGRIITRGYGDTKPLTTNETEQGKAKNRRIEFYIFVQR